MIEPNVHPQHLVTRGLAARHALVAQAALLLRHYGPGAHPGTGTEQTAHDPGGGGGPGADEKRRQDKQLQESVDQRRREDEAHRKLDWLRYAKDMPEAVLAEAQRIMDYYSFDISQPEVRPAAAYAVAHRELTAEYAKGGLGEKESKAKATAVLAQKQPSLHQAATESVALWNKWEANVQQAVKQAEEAGWEHYQLSQYTGEAWPVEKK